MLKELQVPATGTLRDVLLTLDRTGLKIALVVDPRDRLMGIMTDGDVRRALLAGATLDAKLEPHLKRTFISVPPSTARADVVDIMQSRRIEVLPIVRDDGTLSGCHHLHDIIGIPRRPNWAVVMAGGKGARLGALTQHLPKPMIRVAGRPILERIVLHLVGFGVTRIFLSINYLGHLIEEHFGDGSKFGCEISYLREERPLGTGGALALLPPPIEHPLLVINGDLVTQANIGAILDTHDAIGSVATVGVRRYFHTVPFGCVEVDGDRVVAIEEKPTLSRLINAGIYVLSPRLRERIPRDVEFGLPTLVSDCVTRGESVAAFEVEDDWADVGHHDQLRQARGEVPHG